MDFTGLKSAAYASLVLACMAVGFRFVFAGEETANSLPALRWGGDQEGGGPYIFSHDDDPTKIVGFEVDLAEALGRELHRRAEFVQCDWDQMLPVLSRGNIDVALNGYEFTPKRSTQYRASLPYYIYELQLCAKRGNRAVQSWESLRKPSANGSKLRVGVLEGSSADRYVTEQFERTCHVVRYKGITETLLLIESGQLDAAVQDLPALVFYVDHLKRYPQVALVDQPAAPGYYVIYARPDDAQLVAAVNQALQRLWKTGALKAIYERYGIWNATQEKLPEVWGDWNSGPHDETQSKWSALTKQWPLLVKAAGVTVALSLVSMPLAVLIGLIVALVRSSGSAALGGPGTDGTLAGRLFRLPFTVYVEVVRGTPLAFQLFVVYFILPEIGIRINEFWSGVVALAVNYSAYEAEIFRLGLYAIPRGQMEAALSLGMPRFLAIRRIILPQAVRLVIPATANDFIALFKDTAVCSVIAVEELSKQYSMGAKSTGLFFEMAALASILYLLMSYPLSLLSAGLERTLKGGEPS